MHKRKNRPAQRSEPPSRPQPQQKRTVASVGVYNNPIFIHAVSSQLGNTVQLQTRSGAIFEGIFTTFSPQFEILLEMAHQVEKDNDNINVDTVEEKFVFKPSDIVSIVAKDVDPEFATRDTFEIDTAISSRYNGTRGMEHKQLERWESAGESLDNMCLELDSNSNGWDADEMFQKNESLYGVQSTFDHSLAGYTVPIEKSDSHAYRKAELEAEKIAREIENQTLYDERADLENGDEEAQFAAVVRPQGQSPHAFGGGASNSANSNANKNAVVTNASQKYVPPAKRKQGQQMGKLITPQTPSAPIATSPATANSQPPTPQPVVTPPPVAQPPPPQQQQQQQQQQPQGPVALAGPKGTHNAGKSYNASGPNHPSNAAPYATSSTPIVHSNAGPPMSANNNYNNTNNQASAQTVGVETGPQHPQGPPPVQGQNHHGAPPPGSVVVMGGGNNGHNKNSMVHQQQQPPPMRHRGSYGPQSHMPPNMAMAPHSAGAYAPEAPAMGPPPQMVPKGQPPPQHTIVMVPQQVPGQMLVVQGVPPPMQPAGQKMMNQMPQRPPRGREETVQDMKNFQDNYVLAPNPNASPGLTGPAQPPPPQPMMHPQSVYAPPPPTQQQQQPALQAQPPPPAAVLVEDKSQGAMSGPAGGPSPQPPSTSLPPPASAPLHQGQAPAPSPSPAAAGNPVTPGRPAPEGNNATAPATGSGPTTGDKPEAKKSVLNPHAKSFMPRNSSTPNPSRPHTPQSAGAPQIMPGGSVPTMPGAPNGGSAQPAYQQTYLMPAQKPAFPNRGMRYTVPPSVQAATGTPITLPYNLYPPQHPQHFQSPQYSMMRLYTSDAQQPMPYLAPSPHSTTPSPGTQYPPAPAGGGPSQPFPPSAGQQPQFAQIVCPMIPQPMQFHPNAQHPQYANQIILMQSHNPNQ